MGPPRFSVVKRCSRGRRNHAENACLRRFRGSRCIFYRFPIILEENEIFENFPIILIFSSKSHPRQRHRRACHRPRGPLPEAAAEAETTPKTRFYNVSAAVDAFATDSPSFPIILEENKIFENFPKIPIFSSISLHPGIEPATPGPRVGDVVRAAKVGRKP